MMKVKVNVFASLREQTGWSSKEVDLDVGNVKALLENIREGERSFYDVYEESKGGQKTAPFRIFVEGRDIDFLRGLDTELKDGSTVQIFPPIAGGS